MIWIPSLNSRTGMGRFGLPLMTPGTSHLLGVSGHLIREGCSRACWLFSSCPQSFPASGSLPTFVSAVCVCVSCSVMSLCDHMDCSLLGSSVHGILQAGILDLVAIPIFRGSSPSRDRIQISSIVGRFFTIWVTGQALCVYWVIINVNSLLVDVGNNFLWGKPSLGSVHKQA